MVTALYPRRLNMQLRTRFLYERFAEHIADQDRIVVHDPCSDAWFHSIARRSRTLGPHKPNDRSQLDFDISVHFLLFPQDVAAVSLFASDKAAERGNECVMMTLRKAMAHVERQKRRHSPTSAV